jgi:hypothetical protein
MGFLCYMFSYDLEFTVAQNLVAVSNGTLLYQVGYLIFLCMSVVIMSTSIERCAYICDQSIDVSKLKYHIMIDVQPLFILIILCIVQLIL